MLQPIEVSNQKIDVSTPSRICEACRKKVPGDEAINIMMQIGVAGHPSIMPFQCPCEEHWACCRECWKKVAHACIDEHMHEVLMFFHAQVGRQE